MPKNPLKEIMGFMKSNKPNAQEKQNDFVRAKEVLLSSKTPQQLISAVKYINNFNKKHGITETSPEFIYFDKMILVMKLKIKSKKVDGGEQIDESSRMNRTLRNIIKLKLRESLEWSDKDETFDVDKSFTNDQSWSNDPEWGLNPDKSYWKQGDAGTSSGGEDVSESEDDLDWVRNVPDDEDYAEQYKYFDIYVCWGYDEDNEDNCLDGYSTFIKIPKYELNDYDTDSVIRWAINNNQFDPLDEVAVAYVNETDRYDYLDATDDPDLMNESDDLDWIREVPSAPNYKGFPQGVVYVGSHEEIDMVYELINKINPKNFVGRGEVDNLHKGLEYSRNESEAEGYDPYESIISISFFVEKDHPGGLSIGYWPYGVEEDGINGWLSGGDTFNREYRLYNSVYDLEKTLNLFL